MIEAKLKLNLGVAQMARSQMILKADSLIDSCCICPDGIMMHVGASFVTICNRQHTVHVHVATTAELDEPQLYTVLGAYQVYWAPIVYQTCTFALTMVIGMSIIASKLTLGQSLVCLCRSLILAQICGFIGIISISQLLWMGSMYN